MMCDITRLDGWPDWLNEIGLTLAIWNLKDSETFETHQQC